jgi:DNA-damage-inducible protein J
MRVYSQQLDNRNTFADTWRNELSGDRAMAKTASLNIRVDPATKSKAEILFSHFGITLSDAVTLFLNQAIIEGGLPFRVKLAVPNSATIAAMREVESKDAPGRFASPKEMFDDLGI